MKKSVLVYLEDKKNSQKEIKKFYENGYIDYQTILQEEQKDEQMFKDHPFDYGVSWIWVWDEDQPQEKGVETEESPNEIDNKGTLAEIIFGKSPDELTARIQTEGYDRGMDDFYDDHDLDDSDYTEDLIGLDFNDHHPECSHEEMFITNTTSKNIFNKIKWKTKRRGLIAYDRYGNRLSEIYFPIFANKAEVAKRGQNMSILGY